MVGSCPFSVSYHFFVMAWKSGSTFILKSMQRKSVISPTKLSRFCFLLGWLLSSICSIFWWYGINMQHCKCFVMEVKVSVLSIVVICLGSFCHCYYPTRGLVHFVHVESSKKDLAKIIRHLIFADLLSQSRFFQRFAVNTFTLNLLGLFYVVSVFHE